MPYKTPRGYHKAVTQSNHGWNKTSPLSFINIPILSYSDEIRSAVLMLHGEKAHSRYFSEDALKSCRVIIRNCWLFPVQNHVDLYDNIEVIPFGKIEILQWTSSMTAFNVLGTGRIFFSLVPATLFQADVFPEKNAPGKIFFLDALFQFPTTCPL